MSKIKKFVYVLPVFILTTLVSGIALGQVKFEISTVNFFSNADYWYSGYGVKLGFNGVRMEYAKITYNSTTPGNLLEVEGGRGVYSRPGEILSLSFQVLDLEGWEMWCGLQRLKTNCDCDRKDSFIILVGKRLEFLFVNFSYVDRKIGFCIDFNLPVIIDKFNEQILQGRN